MFTYFGIKLPTMERSKTESITKCLANKKCPIILQFANHIECSINFKEKELTLNSSHNSLT